MVLAVFSAHSMTCLRVIPIDANVPEQLQYDFSDRFDNAGVQSKLRQILFIISESSQHQDYRCVLVRDWKYAGTLRPSPYQLDLNRANTNTCMFTPDTPNPTRIQRQLR